MILRPYQEKLINQARHSLRYSNATLLVAATGAGKTAITVHMMKSAAEKGFSSIFCVHRDTLLSQTSVALWKQKVQHGIIAAGRAMTPNSMVQVASVQTLVRRTHKIKEPKLIIIDEAHRSAANTYKKIIAAYPNARIIGLTATPQRTDGKGLSDIYDDMVLGPSVAELIADGWLCDYRIYAPPSLVDTSALKKRMGDYQTEEIAKIMDKPTITGDAVAHYKKFANGKRCVVFCATVEHGQHVCDAYKANGIPAEFIYSDTPSGERQAILKRFASGETLVLSNVELVIEGVDVPAIEAVQWLRPTASLIIWMQGNGRGFRPADGKEKLIILDHVQNHQRHGLPDELREWSLEGNDDKKKAKKSDDEFKIKQCESCFAIFRPGPSECPQCGEPINLKGRKINEADGELRELDLESLRLQHAATQQQHKREQGGARTLKDLVELGKRRGMKDPSGWAANVYAARNGKRPTGEIYQQARGFL